MTISVETLATENVRTGTGSPTTFTAGRAEFSPQGVLIALVNNGSATDHVTAVSYGGVALERVAFASDGAGEPGVAQWWFVGSGLPSGLQTVSYTTGSTGDDFHAVVITLYGDRDIRVIDTKIFEGDVDDPAVDALVTGGRVCMGFCAYFSGLGAVGNITVPGGQTAIHDHDFGNQVSRVTRQTTASASDFTFSFTTSATDDAAIACVAVTDEPPAMPPFKRPMRFYPRMH